MNDISTLAGLSAAYARMDAELDRTTARLIEAEDRLLESDAPDAATLRWKLERLIDLEDADDGFTPGVPLKWARVLRRDIERLLAA